MFKKSLLLTLLLALLVPWAAKGQNLSDYTLTTDVTTFTSIVSTGTKLSFSSNDDGYAAVTLPFALPYGESTIASGGKIACSANGFMYLDQSSTSGSTCSYTSTSYRAVNAIYQQDAHMGRYTDAGAYWQYDETAGTLTIEYHKLGDYYTPYGSYSYQVVFHSNGNIEFIYDEVDHGTATSRTMATYLTDGPKSDKIFVTGAWATPTKSTTYATRPFTPVPEHGLRYTFTRPVFSCPKPTLSDVAAADIEANSATIRWTPSGEGQTLFDIYYSTENTAPTELTTPSYSNVSGTSKLIDGLSSGTVYYVWLRGNCGTVSDPDISGGWTASKQFQTDCGTVASHTWGFEAPNTGGTTSYPLPACWTRPTSGNYPYAYSSNPRTGSNSLYWYSGWSSVTNGMAVLPEIEGGVNGKRLSFYQKGAYSFQVGYMTDPTDATTFVAVLTQTGTASYPSSPYVVDFGAYTGDPKYIAIKSNFTSSQTSSYIYIDDVTLSNTPNCLEPTITGVTSVTTSTASLSWEAGNAGQDHWDIYYSKSSTAPTNETTPTIVNTDQNPYPLTGLQHSSTYYVWVRGNCGGEHSEWSAVYSFPTDCEAVTSFPWSETFEGRPANTNAAYSETYKFIDACWLNEHLVNGTGTNGSETWFQVYSGTTADNNTNRLQLPDMKDGTMTELRLPEMTLPSNNYQFTLDVYRDNNSKANEGIRIFASSNGELEGATELAFIPHYYNYEPTESTIGWNTYELPINMSGTCYIIIRGESKYGTATYMDNFVVEQMPTCARPKNPTSTAQTAHTATLSWTNGEEGQDAWQIAYSTSSTFAPADNFTPGEGEGLADVTTNPATISGLTKNTTYYAYVRANCGGSDPSKWSKAKATFTTKSGNAVPTGLAYDNASLTSSEVTVNWNGVATNDLHASFELYISTESTTPVAAPEAGDNFITGITASTHHFNTLTAETKYYVWVRDNCGADGLSAWSSSIYFTTASACQTPDGLTFSNISSSSLTVDWADHGTVSDWNVRYSSDGGTTWTTIENAAKPCPINGLTGNTEYRVQVQATCNTEAWSAYATCRTAYSVPFTEEFSTTSTPTNWENKTGLLDNVMIGTALTTGSKWSFGTHSNLFNSHARINIYGGIAESNASYGWLITPNITVGNNYSLSFDLALTNYDTPTGMTQPVTPQTTGTDDKFIVLVSTDNEANWTVLRQWDNAGSAYVYNDIAYNGETVYIDLAAYNNQTVRIAFYGESTVKNADNNLHIDNVEINITSDCHKPQNVTASNETNHSATITWVAGSVGQELWQLKYNKGEDFDPNTEGEAVTVETNPTYTFNKTLDAASVYYIYVRGNCGTTTDPDYGPWSKKCIVSTGTSNPAPTAFNKKEVGPDWVDLYWTAPAGDYLSGYGIYYQDAATPAPTAETPATVTIDNPTAPTSENPYRLPNLENEHTYYIWVRANHEANVYSAWTQLAYPYYITTLVACPAPINVEIDETTLTHTTADLTWTGYSDSYTIQKRTAASAGATYLNEGFENNGEWPTGWDNSVTSNDSYKWLVGEGSGYTYVNGYGSSGVTTAANGSYNALYYTGSSGKTATAWLITPTMDLTGVTDAKLSFNYCNPAWSGGIYELKVNYRVDEGEWQLLKTYNTAQESWNLETITLTGMAANYQIGFSIKGYDSDYGYGVGIDDVMVYSPVPAGEWADVATNVTETSYPLTGLSAGTKYDVRVKGNCGGEYSATQSFTTIDDNTKIFKTTGNWNVAGNWDGGIPENMTQNAIIRANVTIPSGCIATANNITFEGTPTPTITMLDGGQLMHNNTGVTLTVHKSITGYGDGDGKWYLLSAPSSPDVDPDDVENMLTGDYDLYSFDYEEVGEEWRNYKQGAFDLASGGGYLYANKANKDLVFTNEIDPIGGTVYYVGITNTNAGTQPFNGLHLIGNWYPCNTYLTIDSVASAFYTMNGTGDEITTAAAGTPIAPCQGIFVLATSSTEQKARFVKELPVTSTQNNSNLVINVNNSATRGGVIDNAIINFGEGNNLVKFQLNPNHTKVYIPQDGKDYAVVNAEAAGEMPVNFKAETNGTYTLSFNSENTEFSYLHLIDNMTGNDVDLLETSSYTFDARYTDYASRFKLVFKTSENGNENDNFGFISNGNLMILGIEGEATLQVIDVTGRILSTETFSGSYNKAVNAAQGVYMIRLIQGENVRTQKIVVK